MKYYKLILILLIVFFYNKNANAQSITRITSNTNWWSELANGTSVRANGANYSAPWQEFLVTLNLGQGNSSIMDGSNMIWGTNTLVSVRLVDTFYLACDICIDSVRYWIAADDVCTFYLNGVNIDGNNSWSTFKTGLIDPKILFPSYNRIQFDATNLGGYNYAAVRLDIYHHSCPQ